MESMGKIMMIFGGILLAVGFLLTFSQRLPFRFGRLPGDIAYEKNGVGIFIPFTSMILLSIVLSVIFWIVSRFNR
ncbi:MAG: DUF2905 domain-containing protein [Armatimonadetes bacterium]|nr:DUF2905 family protein [Armatimonadota bacterium]MBS1700793.1 DUF2905 domain-containing protein [Armatimonadota bacterium]MBS1728717.1 DUF2905 domain-containing protein [Armatimonadota bacterium]